MYLIRQGEINIVSHRATPHETLLARLKPGGFFGEMCLIECRGRSAAAIAATPAVLHALAYADIHRLFKWRPDEFSILILNIARDLCRRLRTMNDRCARRPAISDPQRAIAKMRSASS
jgi:CRP-like cAMP-binding protein